MLKRFKLDPFFFSEGGGDAGAGADASGAQAAAAQEAGEIQQAQPSEQEPESFEKLIAKDGKYRADYEKAVEKVVSQRLRSAKGAEERLSKMDPIMSILADKYGIDAGDIEGIAKAAAADNAMFEEKAMQKGMSVEQYREVMNLKRENARYAAEAENARREQSARAAFEQLKAEADAVTQKFPDFNLETELENPQFQALIRNHIGVETAYMAIHGQDIMQGLAARTAHEIQKKTADTIYARGQRPIENGMSGQAAASVRTDVSKLSRQDRAELAKRALRGDRSIRF